MPNPTITIGPGNLAAFPFAGQDAQGGQEPVHGTITVSDYDKAYLITYAGGFSVVPKITAPAGGSFTLSANLSGFDAAGNPLPSLQFDVTVNGPPAPPLAVVIVPGAPVVVPPGNTDFGTPVDPGSPTISF